MSVPTINTHAEAGGAMTLFLANHVGELPTETRGHVIQAIGHPSPVDRYVDTIEAIFAAKNDVPKSARDLAIGLARFTAREGFHTMQERGGKIAAALSRIGGYAAPDGQEWPDASEDPDPLAKYASAADQAE